jgi:hypothetical protein
LHGPVDVHLLCRSWLRSRSEDTDTEEVYRPEGYAFARQERGRAGYRFNSDGTFARAGIGPTDVSNVVTGTWQMDDEHPDRIRLTAADRTHLLEIADLAPDRLAIRRAPATGGV